MYYMINKIFTYQVLQDMIGLRSKYHDLFHKTTSANFYKILFVAFIAFKEILITHHDKHSTKFHSAIITLKKN